MRPSHISAIIVAATLLAAGSAIAQTPVSHAGHTAPAASPHAGHAAAGGVMKGMAMPGTTMPGMDMSGGGMAGMTMSGMEPPAPGPPPPGAMLRLNAAEPAAPATVRGSPGQIALAFASPTALREVILTNAVGQQTPLHATIPETLVTSFTFPVAIPLRPGEYHLAWDAADPGPGGRGRLAFTVLQADGGSAPALTMSHHH